MTLPESYLRNMKELLGDEFDSWLESFEETPARGLRINTAKVSEEDYLRLTDLKLTPVPWIRNGFYYEDAAAPARHPHYYAGLYYLQEPSAMTPASRLNVQPGQRVLDLCAAPGGKATELGSRLKGQGVLLANDISASRARALLKNLELAGIPNLLVSAEDPLRLSPVYPEYFDRILIDAPCSGEGMFRREHSMVSYWEEAGPDRYVPVQRSLLECGVSMLKKGGKLLYSTCTFSVKEDEENIRWILQQHPELELLPVEPYEGFSPGKLGLDRAVRIFPHKMKGEGHFLALLRKRIDFPDRAVQESDSPAGGSFNRKNSGRTGEKLLSMEKLPEEIREFLGFIKKPFEEGGFLMERDQVYYFLPDVERKKGIHYLRSGLLLGTWKKNRFEPSQALAMALKKEEFAFVCDWSADDPRTVKYLKGETVEPDSPEKEKSSWRLICTDGFPLGWGKLAGSMLKNKYNPGWRWQ